ncbi:MAG: hypothetical protein SO176_04715, partial [Bacilli bacterium]|nr:hypothetical protein [Bacilli bacterium]
MLESIRTIDSGILTLTKGGGHNLGLKYILEGQLIIYTSHSLITWNNKKFELFFGSSFYLNSRFPNIHTVHKKSSKFSS